jgi:hypothetical protein
MARPMDDVPPLTGRPTIHSWIAVLTVSLALCFAVGPSSAASAKQTPSMPANDRSFKLDLISRLKTAPETVILGSSRSKRVEPAYVQTLTGRTGFNAGVISGTAADAWVMTRYLADCFPLRKRRYLWFVDAGIATDGINPDLRADPRSHKYLGHSSAPADCSPRRLSPNNHYNPDGSFGQGSPHLQERPSDLDAKVAKLVASVRAHPPPVGGKPNPKRYVWFVKALDFMNNHGSRPVIVLDPIYPTVLAALRKVGFPERKTSRKYLTQLHKRFDFVVVDAEDIHRWGGSPNDFADPTHINGRNMRRLLAYVVTHSGGALR